MFTGIIQQRGKVIAIEKGDILRYALSFPYSHLTIGASVSVEGVCQTVVALDGGVWFEAIEETCKRTTLGSLQLGQLVHIERSAKIGDEIGGHLLSGHISCTAKIEKIENNIYTFAINDTSYLFEKGFVGVDGMSLTVVDVFQEGFTVHFIPHTLKLFTKKEGDLVNIEFDALTVAAVKSCINYLCKPT